MDKKTMEYVTSRQLQLIKDQHDFEQMLEADRTHNVIFSPDEIRRLIIETQARRNELALMVTCAQLEEQNEILTTTTGG